MGGGGGSRAPTEQRIIQSDLPEYAQPYFTRLLKRGEAESLQPRFQYGADRLAYFSPDEITAQAMTRGYAQSGTPFELQEATRTIQGMPSGYMSGYRAPSFTAPPIYAPPEPNQRMIPGVRNPGGLPSQPQQQPMGGGIRTADMRDANRDGIDDRDAPIFRGGPGLTTMPARGLKTTLPSPIDGRRPDPSPMPMPEEPSPPPRSTAPRGTPYIPDYSKLRFETGVNRFMSPFQQRVTDVAKREARRGSEIEGERIAQQAARAGGLGGYREAILQAERQRNLGQRLDDIQTRGSQQAFDRAVQQVGAERAADLARSQFGLSRLGQLEAQRQAQERLRQSGFDIGNRFALSRASQLANLGQQRQADTLARLDALRRQGAQQRALQQAALDMGYQDFLRQQDATRGQLGFYGGLLRGVPVTPNQTISTMQQQPGLFQSLVGTGLGALGLYRGMR